MKVAETWPPNIDAIRTACGLTNVKPVFTYGDTIYNPYRVPIDAALRKHEETHEKQQGALGVETWWERYLRDPEFRADQEIAAYRVQFRALRKSRTDRNALARWLRNTAIQLSGPMYGGCVPYAVALVRIKQ